jgi:hypothetical protein
LTLEKGYDLLFIGSGTVRTPVQLLLPIVFTASVINSYPSHTMKPMVDMTSAPAVQPSLDNLSADVDGNGKLDQGWLIRLATGEKALNESMVFYKTVYITTFMPNSDPCVPGGYGKVYALNYKTTEAVLDFSKDGVKDPSVTIGGGIPSKVVPVISDKLMKLLVSVGSANPDEDSESLAAGVVRIDP